MATAATVQPTPAHQQSSHFQEATTQQTQKSLPLPHGPTTATLNFYAPPSDGAVPFNYVEEPPAGQPQRNFGVSENNVSINDIRGREKEFTLDKNAFATVSGVHSDETEWVDDEHIKNVYYPEVEKLVLDHVPGAKRVLIFDHTIRRSTPNAHRAPVTRVHIDQTPKSAAMRVEYHLPDEAEELLKGRYRIINVWRPLNGPVYATPLAFGDAATVKLNDIIPVQHIYPDRTGETAGVQFNKNTEFYYLSGMRNDERLFLQCSDSTAEGTRVPHTAFTDPNTPEGAPGRESIEVRTLVFG